ncbi:MAG: HlyC/CorC family transporter [Verrucomicrobiae bacterium]|nr:HlyC/CorC family transporter [Verrucomicrobiae bacterium]
MFIALAVAFLLILCLLSALMTVMETAVLSIREHEREALANRAKTPQESRAIRLLQENPEQTFDQILLVGSVVHLMLAVMVLVIVKEAPFGLTAVPAAALLFGLVLVATELVPKALALNRPRSVFIATAPLLLIVNTGLRGVTTSLVRGCDRIVGALTPESLRPSPSLMEEELDTLVEMRQEEGALDVEESEVIREILRLGNRTAKDCMTPRTDACVLPDDLPFDEADRAIRAQNHWSIPIFHGQPDSIVGVLDVRSYLNEGTQSKNYLEHLKPPVFVPESMNALRLFNAHLTDPFSMVVVLDEYGGFEGIVSAADMLEELIGDAAPSRFIEVDIQEIGKGRFLVSGSARLDDLGELLDVDLEHEGLDTIGGLVFTMAGELPKRGAIFNLADGITTTVRKSSKTRVDELIVERQVDSEEENSL